MNPRKNLLLLLVLLLAGGAYYLFDVKWAGEEKTEEERKAKVLKGLDEKRLLRIALEREKEPYQAIRTEKGWRFVKPVDAAVDKEEFDKLVKGAAGLKETRRIGSVQDLSEFGLAKPGLRLTFGLKGREVVVLHIGDRSPTRASRYAALKGGPVFTLPSESVDLFDKPVFALRDKTVVPIKSDKAQMITVAPGGETPFTVVRREKDDWEMTVPVADKAASTDSEGVASGLYYARVHRFVEEKPKDLAKYGLDKPTFTVRVYTDKKGKEGDGLILGKSVREETVGPRGAKSKKLFYYGRRLSGGPVFLVRNTVVKDLPRTAFALRHKTVLDYDVDDITRLRIEMPGETVDVRRLGKKKWDLRVTKAGAAEAAKLPALHKHVDDVLWDIKWANAVEYVDSPGEELAKYGLG
ncbi:MAG: DUF4340 domain-containing protein, partial [bacterium]